MPRTREHSLPTRQLYASIREDIYLAAKARAAELRLPMRRFIEDALANAMNWDVSEVSDSSGTWLNTSQRRASLWDDQYLQVQASQPLGAPLNLSQNEARRVALEAFEISDETEDALAMLSPRRIESEAQGHVGDPVELSDEDAEEIARETLMFGISGVSEARDG